MYVRMRGIIGENRERAKVAGGQQSVLSGGTTPGEFSWMLLPGTSLRESRSAMTYEYTIKRSRRSFRRVRSSFTRSYAISYLTFDTLQSSVFIEALIEVPMHHAMSFPTQIRSYVNKCNVMQEILRNFLILMMNLLLGEERFCWGI